MAGQSNEQDRSELGAVLEEAKHLICGDRRVDYGDVEDSFKDVAYIWSRIFKVDVTPEQVALAMAGLKLCREFNAHKHDNLTDICGYAALADYLHNV